RNDLVVGEEAFFLTLLNELVELFDVGERDVDREQRGPSLSLVVLGRGGSTSTRREPGLLIRLPSGRRNIQRDPRRPTLFSTWRSEHGSFRSNLSDRLAVAIHDRSNLEPLDGVAKAGNKGGERRADSSRVSVLDLDREAETTRAGSAHQAFGAAFGNPALASAHEDRVVAVGAAAQPRGSATRRGASVSAVESLEPGVGERHSLQRKGEGDDTAAVDPRPDVLLGHVGCARHLRQHRSLAGGLWEPVAARLPAVRAAQREHPGMLPGAVVLDRLWRVAGRPALELVLARGSACQECSGGSELLGQREV